MSYESNISDTTIVSTRQQITIADAKAHLSLVDEAEKRDIALTVRGELHVCCCPFHGEATPSFNIYPDDHYHCYGCGAHGDVIEFITRHDEITIPELLTQLTTDGQIIPGAAPSKAIREKRPEPLVIMPVPADAPRLIGIDRRTRDVMKPYVAPGEKATVRYNPAMTFAYKDVDGQLLGYVLRLHILDEVTGKTKKVPVPVTWCRFPDGREGWSSVGFPRPHPLFGLDKAVNAKVHFYTEGEKTKMAAERFVNVAGKTDWAALTWSNGANAVDHADFSISEGKTCIIWRDADDVGLAAQERLVTKLTEAKALNVFTVNLPEDLSKGWDIADAEEEGWTHTNVFDWIENNSIEIEVTTTMQAATAAQYPLDCLNADANAFLARVATDLQLAYGNECRDLLRRLHIVDPEANLKLMHGFTALGIDTPRVRAMADDRSDKPSGAKSSVASDLMDNGSNPVPLGYNGDAYYYLSAETESIVKLRAVDHSRNNLRRIASNDWWNIMFPKQTKDGCVTDWDAATAWAMKECHSRRYFDTTTVRGTGAYKDHWDGVDHSIYHNGANIFIDGCKTTFLEINKYSKYIYERQVAMVEPNFANPMSDAEALEMYQAFRDLSWQSPCDGDGWIGWLVLAPILGRLSYRPMGRVAGMSNSGKTYVMSLSSELLGSTALHMKQGSTESGIRQAVENNARPCIYDEAEGEDEQSRNRMKSINGMMRNATDDSPGAVYKGSAKGTGPQVYNIKLSMLMASIGNTATQTADLNRITPFQLKTGLPKDAPAEEKVSAAAKFAPIDSRIREIMDSKDIQGRFLARVLNLADIIIANAKTANAVMAALGAENRQRDQDGGLMLAAHSFREGRILTADEIRTFILDSGYDVGSRIVDRKEDQLWDSIITAEVVVQFHVKDSTPTTLRTTIRDLIQVGAGYGGRLHNIVSPRNALIKLNEFGIDYSSTGNDKFPAGIFIGSNSRRLKEVLISIESVQIDHWNDTLCNNQHCVMKGSPPKKLAGVVYRGIVFGKSAIEAIIDDGAEQVSTAGDKGNNTKVDVDARIAELTVALDSANRLLEAAKNEQQSTIDHLSSMVDKMRRERKLSENEKDLEIMRLKERIELMMTSRGRSEEAVPTIN